MRIDNVNNFPLARGSQRLKFKGTNLASRSKCLTRLQRTVIRFHVLNYDWSTYTKDTMRRTD